MMKSRVIRMFFLLNAPMRIACVAMCGIEANRCLLLPMRRIDTNNTQFALHERVETCTILL